ncbi:NUDIX hydrolase [Clostridium isatidis]|uniref:Coenzyme A pyrophosphatase n=1 Tax=Clostridium isatidis TaxID=182773 RepID=A0A343JB39_9CLOT|nr:CoA pyrophosphatase [Clostridium isatidis]ASW42747.1 coenzyme A pyrophosphatase [Clostridium isatidis]NLZ34517.1 CoA pyrophosphatase [Clostridiales bacterium]
MINNLIKKFNNNIPYISGWKKMKRSAVAILLLEIGNKLNVVFEIRAKSMKTQPGDISFTGGGIEKAEKAEDAVIREIKEEIGLDKEDFDIICPLDLLITHYNQIIHPYLGYIKNPEKIQLNLDEVEELLIIPLEELLKIKPIRVKNKLEVNRDNFPYHLINGGVNYNFYQGELETLFYVYKDKVIWGMTAKILEDFINIYKKCE